MDGHPASILRLGAARKILVNRYKSLQLGCRAAVPAHLDAEHRHVGQAERMYALTHAIKLVASEHTARHNLFHHGRIVRQQAITMVEIDRCGICDSEISGARRGSMILRSLARVSATNKEQIVTNDANDVTVLLVEQASLMRCVDVTQHADTKAGISDAACLVREHQAALHLHHG